MRRWLLPLAVAALALAFAASSLRAGAEESPPREQPAAIDTATQSSDPSIAAATLFKRAEAEDTSGDYGSAASDYRAAVAKLPSFRYAAKAITRAALLEAHAEGSWGPYRQLESVRRDPSASSDPRAIDALAENADSFPPGPTRSEARMVCADAYLSRLHRRADGEAALRKVTGDPRADGLLRREAAVQLVTALIDDGDLAVAQTTARDLGSMLDARMAKRVGELLRRRKAHLASIVDLVLFSLLAAIAVARAASRGALGEIGRALRKMLPLGVAFGGYVALAGGALASGYETGNAQPFFAFGAVLVPLAFATRAWSAAGSASPLARAGRALLSATAVVAAAFLVLEMVNGQYLEGFKL